MHLAVPRSLIARVLNAKATIERSSIAFTANGKRDFFTLDQVCRLLFARKSVDSRHFYPKIVLSCFYLFMINISYFKKYSIWIPRLPFAVNTIRNLTVSKPWTSASSLRTCLLKYSTLSSMQSSTPYLNRKYLQLNACQAKYNCTLWLKTKKRGPPAALPFLNWTVWKMVLLHARLDA